MKRLSRIAAGLYRARLALWGLAAASLLWLGIGLARETSADDILPALTGLLWAILLLGIAYGLSLEPAAIEPDDGLWRRLKKRVYRAAFSLVAVLALGLGGLVAYLTWRMLGLATA